jgi:hypothetical protein
MYVADLSLLSSLFTLVNSAQMGVFSVKRVAGDGNSLFWSLAVLLENANYYFVFRYLIADADIVLYCAEYSH